MEECIICYNNFKNFKTLGCLHKLCESCYLKLQKQSCPYCRTPFQYTKEDLYLKLQKNSRQENDVIINSYPEMRITTYQRRRRRDLSIEEISKRREIIRRKCKKKWKSKEARLNKMKWYDID